MLSERRRSEILREATSALAEAAASEGWGPDTEWFASDRDGHVAMLSTAGLGPIPTRATSDPAGHAAVWEALEVHGIPMGLGELDFYDLAVAPKAGAFAFDYSASDHGYGSYSPGQAYRRIGLPSDPVKANQLSSDARTYLTAVCFRDTCFAAVESLMVEETFASIHRPTIWD